MCEVSGSYLNLIFQQNSSDSTLVGEGECSLTTCQTKVESMPHSAALTLGGNGFLLLLVGVSAGPH